MAALEARSVVGLAGAVKRWRQAETSGRQAETNGRRVETRGETGAETRGEGDEEEPMLREDDEDGSGEVQERMLRITAIKNRFSLPPTHTLCLTHTISLYLPLSHTHTLSHTQTRTLSLTHTPSLSFSHSLSLSLSLSLTLSLCQQAGVRPHAPYLPLLLLLYYSQA